MSDIHEGFEIHLVEHEPSESVHPEIWILFTVEFLAMVFAVVYIPFIIRILNKTPLLHKNVVRISEALLFLYYPNILSRFVLFLHELSIVEHEGNVVCYIIIVVASFVHSWCSCAMALYLPSVIIERCFASKFIADYEKISRTWISGIIIALGYIVSAIIAASILLGFYHSVVLVVGFCVLMTICCLLYIALYRRDSERLRDINRGVIPKNVIYTLSTRFQLTENLRVLKILMQLSIVMAVSCVATSFFFVLSEVFKNHIQFSRFCFALTNLSLAMESDVFIIVFMISLGLHQFRSVIPLSSKFGITPPLPKVNDHRGAYNTYFNQISSTWKI
ncbi:hypothetical protein V3C99_013018 [Haemonchus contortus]